MARERPLEPAAARTWLAMWEQRDAFCDDAVRHLQTLISDNHCFVVVTLGTGREPRSLVFRRWRHVLPLARYVTGWKAQLRDYESYKMLVGPAAPTLGIGSQFWHQTGEANGFDPDRISTGRKAEKVFQWNGSYWTLFGHVHDDPIITRRGMQECSFMEALAGAHDLARWNKGAKVIYTFDDSTWGNA
jgi:hypothetical protein